MALSIKWPSSRCFTTKDAQTNTPFTPQPNPNEGRGKKNQLQSLFQAPEQHSRPDLHTWECRGGICAVPFRSTRAHRLQEISTWSSKAAGNYAISGCLWLLRVFREQDATQKMLFSMRQKRQSRNRLCESESQIYMFMYLKAFIFVKG